MAGADEEGVMTAVTARYGKSLRGALLAMLVMVSGIALAPQAAAEPLILQGATTFNRRVIEPHLAEIEAKSGQELTVIPNRTMLGLIALMEGRAHLAMTSAPLETEVAKLKKAMPGLDYDRLQVFDISTTRVAFVVHPSNTVRKASMDQIKKVLMGEITNWKELGGKDAPIRMAFVGGGGGVITSVEAQLLGGHPVQGPNILYVKTALQLVSIMEQSPDALGMAQLSLTKQKGLPEIVTDRTIEQSLNFVTFGKPTPAMKSVIEAARRAVENSM
jgi:phosphate transport system substrate-binding protein